MEVAVEVAVGETLTSRARQRREFGLELDYVVKCALN
jgi:hypothetical protein